MRVPSNVVCSRTATAWDEPYLQHSVAAAVRQPSHLASALSQTCSACAVRGESGRNVWLCARVLSSPTRFGRVTCWCSARPTSRRSRARRPQPSQPTHADPAQLSWRLRRLQCRSSVLSSSTRCWSPTAGPWVRLAARAGLCSRSAGKRRRAESQLAAQAGLRRRQGSSPPASARWVPGRCTAVTSRRPTWQPAYALGSASQVQPQPALPPLQLLLRGLPVTWLEDALAGLANAAAASAQG